MSNTLLTPSIIAREALLILENNLVASNLVYRDYTTEFTGAKVGDTVTIRTPATFVANEFTPGGNITVQQATETGVALQLEKHYDVSFQVTSRELSLSIQDFGQQFIVPAMVAIADAIDRYLLGKYFQTFRAAGSVGTGLTTLAALANVDLAMNNAKIPVGLRNAIVNPVTKAQMLGIDAVVKANERGDAGTALREASMGRVMGADWWMAQNVARHIAGQAATSGTWKTNGAVIAGAVQLNLKGGAGTETVVVGDIFTVAGVFEQDGVTLKQFVVTSPSATAKGGDVAFTASAGNVANLTFFPPAPVGGLPDNTAVTFTPSHAANLAFHPNAFALCVVPLELPMGAAHAEYIADRGLGVRVVYDYNSQSKTDVISLDILVGAKTIQPELAVRVLA